MHHATRGNCELSCLVRREVEQFPGKVVQTSQYSYGFALLFCRKRQWKAVAGVSRTADQGSSAPAAAALAGNLRCVEMTPHTVNFCKARFFGLSLFQFQYTALQKQLIVSGQAA